MSKNFLKKTISFINKTDDLSLIKEKLLSIHPADINNILQKSNKVVREKIYNSLDDKSLASVFSYLDNPDDFLEEIKTTRILKIFEIMDTDDLNYVFEKIDDPKLIELYIETLSKEKKSKLLFSRKIKENRVGRVISTNYLTVSGDIDIKEAMKHLIKDSHEDKVIDPIFVTKDNALVGVLDLKELIIARSPKLVSEIMDDKPVTIDINESINEAINKIKNYNLNALPVLDNNKLVGIITGDEAFEIYSDSAFLQYRKLAGVSSDDLNDKKFTTRLFERLPWLIVLLLLGIITTNLMDVYENVIQSITILVFFQIMILDMAGNVGTQSLAVTIQTLIKSDNKMTNKEIKKHLTREILINVLNSLFLTLISFTISFLFIHFFGNDGFSTFKLALTISVSLGITLIISAFFGAMLPILFSKIKINPAVASGPLITTINDIVAILIYFNLAALLFNLTV